MTSPPIIGRAPGADDPRAAFIFADVPDEIIGDFGLVGGGAAGIELDCITTDLGSPPNMLRLASSEGHSNMMLLVNEEFGVVPANPGGDQNPRVRADLAFGETPSGGALFATSSIAWCGVAVAQQLRQQRVEDHRQRPEAVFSTRRALRYGPTDPEAP